MKTMFHRLPWRAIRMVADLMTQFEGEKDSKYPAGKWRTEGLDYQLDAMMRHYTDWMAERIDGESGVSHLVHMAFRALAAAEIEAATRKSLICEPRST